MFPRREAKDKEAKDENWVIMCCEEGDFAEKIREKVMLRIRPTLEDRGNVVMTRLNDEDLAKIDALVEVEVFKSRSEAAAYFIKEGIQAPTRPHPKSDADRRQNKGTKGASEEIAGQRIAT